MPMAQVKLLTTSIALLMFIISFVVMVLPNIILKKTFTDREKSSPFECGFDSKSSARIPFSLQFFSYCSNFPNFWCSNYSDPTFSYLYKNTNLMYFTFITGFFLAILLIGLYHEWKQGALNWAY